MEICDSNHEQVVHDESECPVCKRMNEAGELESTLEQLQNDNEEYEKQSTTDAVKIDELQNEIKEIKANLNI